MTASEDYISFEDAQNVEAEPNYPTVFGITLTPTASGIAIAILGVAGSLYLLLNLVMPAWQKYQELIASRDQKQALVAQKQSVLAQTEKVRSQLVQAKQQQTDVLALFADEKTLDTLLLDLNKVVEAGNAKLPNTALRAKLKRFVPVNQVAEPITDGSLGPEVNGKLKRRIVNVELEGTFEQTQSILRNIERLQPLLLIKDYQSTLAQASANGQGKAVRPVSSAPITTSFQLQALIPSQAADTTVNQPPK